MNPVLDDKTRTVSFGEKTNTLTNKEYGILTYLMENAGEVCSSEQIYQTVWDAEPFDCRLIISVHIRHIREKIEKDPSNPSFIKAIWGRGYRFENDAVK